MMIQKNVTKFLKIKILIPSKIHLPPQNQIKLILQINPKIKIKQKVSGHPPFP